ncbi:GntR family transcriptional regulator [Paenibacillus hamazuiensis]|uniref:GntR family transcriptional regulator n=1 Tax=Paenibacillus hamazuiensis TaxID=2936508 RepID=UPI00200FD0DF|nr:GntR family transcriptional regulator [Paenibacillus hamazuiensis]
MNKYIEIAKILIDEMDAHMIAGGEKLPTEKAMAERFRTSRETIRKALKSLVEMGRIYSIQGSGYYVRQKGLHMESTLNRYSSITDLISRSNLAVGDLEIQIFKRRPAQEEQVLLQTDKQDWVFIVDRIRAADGEPIVYSQNIVLQSIVGDDFPNRFESGSLSRYLEQSHGITISEALMEIKTVSEEDSLPFRLKQSGAPLLKFVQIHYDAKAKPIFLSYDYMRNDLIRFFVRRTRMNGG